MKQLLLTITLFIMLVFTAFAQTPQSFFYQAVVRDSGGSLINNQLVNFRLSIRQTDPLGTIVYQEIQPITTNDYGLVNIEVGTGLVGIGSISTIDWSAAIHFLQVEFDPAGGFSFIDMGTSQLVSVPYALHAASADNVDDADADPNNEIQDISIAGNELSISGGSTITLPAGGGSSTLDEAYDGGGSGLGRVITADAGAVEVSTTNSNAVAMDLSSNATGAVALRVRNFSTANSFSSIQAETNSNSNLASAVVGSTSGAAWGVTGQVESSATAEAGIYGSNLRTNGGHGVLGIGYNGLVGETNYSSGYAIYGDNTDQIAPLGNGIGVVGIGYVGVYGEDRYLGGIAGAYGVFSNGDMGATGIKAFCIDHPEDPQGKWLKHFSIESNEVLNVYRGTIVCDDNGEAIVEMPSYFDAINTEPSYQLTPIGQYAALYIKEELTDGRFIIGGGAPNMKVSWTLTALRNDPYLQQHPEKREVEPAKSQRAAGKVYMPELYGLDKEYKLNPSPKSNENKKMSKR